MKILSSCRVRILTPNPCLHLYKFRLWFFVNRSPRLFPCSQPRCILLPMRWCSVFHLPALKGWKTLNLGQHQSTHPCHKSAAASKTQNTDIDIDCVSTKQSWAKNLIPESDFSPLFKTSLRFWVTRGHLAGRRWQLLGQTPPFESSWLPWADWVVVSWACSVDSPIKPLTQKGPGDHLKGSTEMPSLSRAELEIRAKTMSWCSHDVGFNSGWNLNCPRVMTGICYFVL